MHVDSLLFLFCTDNSSGVIRRALVFAQIFIGLPPLNNATVQIEQQPSQAIPQKMSNNLALSLLVGKLHDALNKVERFPVLVNDSPGTVSGLKYLTQPFKLRLQKGFHLIVGMLLLQVFNAFCCRWHQ
jgi:hypothetical protein